MNKPKIVINDPAAKSNNESETEIDAPMGLEFYFGGYKFNIRLAEDGVSIRKTVSTDWDESISISPKSTNHIIIK